MNNHFFSRFISDNTTQTRMDSHSAAGDGCKPLVRAAVTARHLAAFSAGRISHLLHRLRRAALAPLLLLLMLFATPAAWAQQPTVTLLTPSNSQVFVEGATAAFMYISARAITSPPYTITQVDFYSGTTLIGSDTTPFGSNTNGIYEFRWLNVPVGSYSLTARTTDSAGQVATSAAVAITVVPNQAPQITLNTPAGPYTAQASIVLSATASDADGRVARVTFHNGTTFLGMGTLVSGTASNGTWNFTWGNVTAGAYVVNARAADNWDRVVASNQIQITVNPPNTGAAPGMYFIEVDHLNTPRRIANQSQQTVWKMDNTEAFGDSTPNENPSNLGTFEFNQRFPGQYADKETGLSYNYFRDYNAALGRYTQSDPIGLQGGLNTYLYVKGSPLMFADPKGLDPPGSRGNQNAGWWWNAPQHPFNKGGPENHQAPPITFPWPGSGEPNGSGGLWIWRPWAPGDGCRIVARLICGGIGWASGVGFPRSGVVAQSCSYVLVRECDRNACVPEGATTFHGAP